MERNMDLTWKDLKVCYQDRQVSAHLLGVNLGPEENGLVYHQEAALVTLLCLPRCNACLQGPKAANPLCTLMRHQMPGIHGFFPACSEAVRFKDLKILSSQKKTVSRMPYIQFAAVQRLPPACSEYICPHSKKTPNHCSEQGTTLNSITKVGLMAIAR